MQPWILRPTPSVAHSPVFLGRVCEIILDDICGLNYDPSHLTSQGIYGSITHVSATGWKPHGQTLGTRSGMKVGATKVLDCNGRFDSVKRLEDEEDDTSFLVTGKRQVPCRSGPITIDISRELCELCVSLSETFDEPAGCP